MTEKTVQAQKMTKVVVFSVNDEQYGVPIENIISIEKVASITRVPHQKDFVKGITNLRGLVVPIVDIKKRFRMGDAEETDESRLIVVKMDELTVGLLVDDAKQVIEIDLDAVDETPDIVGGPEADYIQGVAKVGDEDFLILLNLQKVLTDEEVQTLHQTEA